MKVTFEENYKQYYTVQEAAQAREVIKECKLDACTPADYATMFERYDRRYTFGEILKASARTARITAENYERFGENCGHMGVVISATVEAWDNEDNKRCIIEFSVPLHEIWDENYKNIYRKVFKAN